MSPAVESNASSRLPIRFTIGTIMTLMAVIAGAIVGYQRGFLKGENEWKAMPLSLRSYFVGDIVVFDPDTRSPRRLTPVEVLEQVRANAISEKWENAGDLEIQAFESSLIIQADMAIHNELADYLHHLREERKAFDPQSHVQPEPTQQTDNP